MIKLDKNTKEELLKLKIEKDISIEGNILKLIDAGDDEEFSKYLEDAILKDKENRRKRLDVTKKVQSQYTDLVKWKEENEKIQEELKVSLEETESAKNDAILAREEAEFAKEEALMLKEEAEVAKEIAECAKRKAENAKKIAEDDLELLQKKNQFELMEKIVKAALWVILSIGIIVTGVFILSMFSTNPQLQNSTSLVGTAWTNLVSILVTNCFSIVGTIMGVKYAHNKKD